jgi:isopentenyl-diphosphate delta-isomerase
MVHPGEVGRVSAAQGAGRAERPRRRYAASAVEEVVLVDEQDRPVGTAEKLAAHRNEGLLHRALSVFLFDERGRMLLQQRAAGKYHFPLLWTNACCSHPRPGEAVVEAARRRVREELGVDVQPRPVFAFLYEARDGASGLVEREYDHVLIARLDVDPSPSPDEVEALEWWEPGELLRDVVNRPERYTPWFRQALPELERRGLLDLDRHASNRIPPVTRADALP